jgi:peptidyl-Asp metalloendopeptidase
MKRLPLLFLCAAFLGLACLFYVAGTTSAQSTQEPKRLFEPLSADTAPVTNGVPAQTQTAAIREQEISVNFGRIDFAEAHELSLPLLGGLSYTAVRGDAEGFAESAGGGFVWRGKISAPGGWTGDVTLSAEGRALSGLIYSPEGVYEIVPQKDFTHLLVQIDQSRFPACAGTLPARPASETARAETAQTAQPDSPNRLLSSAGASAAADDGSVIDVLVAYTADVRTSLGGMTQVEAFAQQGVNITNTAYINSDIRTRLRLAGTLEAGYTEVGDLSTALRWAANDPAVNAARNSTKADLVSFVVERGGGGCGIGYLMTNVGPGFAINAYTAVARSCAVGNLSFAHELGHNQGCEHNPENGGPPDEASYPYAFGHWVDGSFRTVMSYSDPCTPPSFCPRVAYFSNPSVKFNGVPTGVADQRDNHRVINNTALVVSQFRDGTASGPPANDNFANAASIGGGAGTLAASNGGATRETNEPRHGFRDGSASVWYNWQAPSNGAATITTAPSTFNTLLGVYTGSSVGALTVVANNDDVSLADLTSKVTFNATAGTTYRVAVDGVLGATGDFTLKWSFVSSCTYSVSPASQSFGEAGGSGSVNVNAGAGCGWTAASNSGFLSVTGANSGSGNGTVAFSVAANPNTAPRSGTLTIAGQTFTVSQAASTASTVQLGAATFAVNESERKVLINVTRAGDTSAPASVSYATSDGTASRLGDYTQTLGTLAFAPNETTKAVTVFITDDVWQEGPETFAFTLSNASGTALALGSPASAVVTINSDDTSNGPNPVGEATFNPDFFVRQHYIDFLNREPDAEGLAFWSNQTTNCAPGAAPAACRVNVSAAFFLSIEFQNTGYFVYRMYKSAYGDASSPNVAGTVPSVRLDEFLNDTGRIGQGGVVGQGAWEAQLRANKEAYALEFVQSPRFVLNFPPQSSASFVDTLRARTGAALSQTERDRLVAELTANNTNAGRASVLLQIAEDADLQAAEKTRAYVLMQYFGYLRRNPNDAPNTDFTGWKFWLDKLNQFGGDAVAAEMVKAFLESNEYRQRFGP